MDIHVLIFKVNVENNSENINLILKTLKLNLYRNRLYFSHHCRQMLNLCVNIYIYCVQSLIKKDIYDFKILFFGIFVLLIICFNAKFNLFKKI